jgi:hypothetical protein
MAPPARQLPQHLGGQAGLLKTDLSAHGGGYGTDLCWWSHTWTLHLQCQLDANAIEKHSGGAGPCWRGLERTTVKTSYQVTSWSPEQSHTVFLLMTRVRPGLIGTA